jgi:hypothetical protein
MKEGMFVTPARDGMQWLKQAVREVGANTCSGSGKQKGDN